MLEKQNECLIKHEDLQMFEHCQIKKMNNFYPLEVVGHGSETQLQVVENNEITLISVRVKRLDL